jgi:hypothetical protein
MSGLATVSRSGSWRMNQASANATSANAEATRKTVESAFVKACR